MKFGKRILSQQFSEWSSQYLDYKGLKKFIGLLLSQPISDEDRKTSFFFRLERELEKVNSFYLQKENDLKVRLKTLNDKTKLIELDSNRFRCSQLEALQEAFSQFEKELNKLQQYVKLNNEGFQKILKKWDKRFKSQTKELYLSRQIDIQPCFNHQLLAEFADTLSTNRMQLNHLIKSSKQDHIQTTRPTSTVTNNSIDEFETNFLRALSTDQPNLIQAELNRVLYLDNVEYGDSFNRIFFDACSSGASTEIIKLFINSKLVRLDYVDDINERTVLHVATMNGRLDILELLFTQQNTLVNGRDIYGRTPLHYATMKGYDSCIQFLIHQHADLEARDLDRFSPLLCAIANGHPTSVEILLNAGVNIEPQNETDHIPFSLACFNGYTEIALMLYRRGAKNLPNQELLYPLHLVAERGHTELCSILAKDHAYLDKPDIYYNWTPLFWAANYGHIECVRILMNEGCQLNLKDENGKTALHYAAWEGHSKCVQIMIEAGCQVAMETPLSLQDQLPQLDNIQQHVSTTNPPILQDNDEAVEMDAVPSLELPPPIIPFRIYGHSYLDKKHQIKIVLEQPPIKLYDNTPISSIKLIISLKPGIGVVPHSLILPMAHQREIFNFQVNSIAEDSMLEFNVLPTFGTRVLGKGVATFSDLQSPEGHRTIPLLDARLNTVGELVFDYFIVKPFLGSQLEIGGRVETYWKSKMTGATLLTGVTENILPATEVTSYVTALSLSGNCMRVVVQLTKDRVPVIFEDWVIPFKALDLSVSDLTFHQLYQMQPVQTLSQLLKNVSSGMGILLELKYPAHCDLQNHSFSNIADKNSFVDCILQCIYDHILSLPINEPSTRIAFSSLNPAICSVVNWKQPNFPVFLCTHNSFQKIRKLEKIYQDTDVFMEQYSSLIQSSFKEAVKFSKRNNLLGIIADAKALVQVPSLISNIKESGLVLISDLNDDQSQVAAQRKYGVDAVMMNNMIHFDADVNY